MEHNKNLIRVRGRPQWIPVVNPAVKREGKFNATLLTSLACDYRGNVPSAWQQREGAAPGLATPPR